MLEVSRRGFLGSLAAAGGTLGLLPQGLLLAQVEAEPVPGLDSLFLTWQGDPTTTMTVQWVGPETAHEKTITFAAQNGEIWQTAPLRVKPYVGTDLKVFRSELQGLQPGSEYRFRVGSALKEYRFRTMPAKATDEITFVTGGDAGIGQSAVLSNMVAARQEPYFAHICGDLAYDNGRSPETFLTFLQNYSGTMIDAKGRLIPLIGAFGNHEVNGSYGRSREDAPSFLSVFDGFFSEKTYGVLDFGDYLSLVIMDTGHVAPVAGEQTDWLNGVLAARQDIPHLIVANHVPCYPSYRNPKGSDGGLGVGEDQRKLWCPLYEQYRVDLVLEHHDHTFKKTHPLTNGMYDKNGILYLGDGSWGKLRVPKTPEERPYLAKVSQAYHITTHRLEGETRFHVALEETGKVADVTMTTSKRAARRG